MSSHTRLNAALLLGVGTIISCYFGSVVSAQHRTDGPVNVKSDAAEHPAQRLTTPAIPANPTKTNDAAERAADAKVLERRAGEQSHDDPNARSMVLGMDLQEGPAGRPVVIGVGVATPAYDAGIKKGDEIVAYQNFTAPSYRRWVDGIRRLTSDAPGNSPILVVVNRDGNRVPVTIQVPVTPARPLTTRVPGTRTTPPIPPGQTVVGQQAAAPPTGGGGNVLIDNSNQLGNFFGNDAASANERGIAQIVRLHDRRPNENSGAANEPTAGSTAAPGNAASAPARIGLAGFRDDPSGMVVMVDVGSLQPGTYSVAIGDPSVMSGGGLGTSNIPGQDSNIQTQPGATGASATTPTNQGNPSNRVQDAPNTAAPNGTPSNGPTKRAGQSQSSIRPTSLIPRTVLAQVGNTGQTANAGTTIPATGSPTGGTSIPATGQVNPITAPATGKVNPSSTTATGQSSINNAQREQANQNAAAGTTGSGAAGGVGSGSGTLGDVGMLTVDQSGTGRMQQTVEGTRVRNVVGQAIILYSQGDLGQATLPANLNGSGGAGSKQGVVDALNVAQGDAGKSAAGATRGNAAVQQATPNSRVPVAAGIIRLVPDHPTTGGAAGAGTASSTNPESTAPGTATPKTGPDLVR